MEIKRSSSIKNKLFATFLTKEILSAFIISLIIVFEAIVFSTITKINIVLIIYTACILGLVFAFIGGKKGSIAGFSGTIAVVLLLLGAKLEQILPQEILQKASENGELSHLILQYILFTTLISGFIQILFGFLKLAKYIRLVPNYVVFGLINGLVVITVAIQFYTFENESFTYYILVGFVLFSIYAFSKTNSAIPSTFVALVAIIFVVNFFDIQTKTLGDLSSFSGSFSVFSIPKFYIDLDIFLIILLYAILLATVGILESLLMQNALDEMQNNNSNANNNSIALGTGNILCGFLGSPAGSTLSTQTILNFKNGANSRLSMFLVPVFLVLFVLYFLKYILLIPVASLVGILLSVPLFLLYWENKNKLKSFKNYEKMLMLLIATATIYFGLESTFFLSVFIVFVLYLISLKFRTFYCKKDNTQEDYEIYKFFGFLCKINIKLFLKLFDFDNMKDCTKTLVLDFENAKIIDKTALVSIDKIALLCKRNQINLKIKNLSNHCKENLKFAHNYCKYEEDCPNYKIAIDK